MHPEPHPQAAPENPAPVVPEAAEAQGAFAAMVEHAAQAMRQAIKDAEHTLAAQLKQAGLDGLLPNGTQSLDAPLASLLNDVVAATFAQTKRILEQAEQTLDAVQSRMHTHHEEVQKTYHEQSQATSEQAENTSGTAMPVAPVPAATPPMPAVPMPEVPGTPFPTTEPQTPEPSEPLDSALTTLLQTIERASQHE